MKSKKISNFYSKLIKMDKDYRENGHFEDQGNGAFLKLLLRYMGYKKPFKDYFNPDIPSPEVYTCAETGDWSGFLSFIKKEEYLSDISKNTKLEITDKILKQMENKIDFIMDYIEKDKINNIEGDVSDSKFLESIV